jgi:hypothetical protein
MLPGTFLLGISALMLYQGFTGNSAVGEIQKLIGGQPAFGRAETSLADQVSGGKVSSKGQVGKETRTEPSPVTRSGGSGGGAVRV